MAKQYWIRREGKTSGPFSGQQLKQMAAAGMILAADLISTDQVNWKPAGQVKGLFQTEQPAEDSGTGSPAPSVSTVNDRCEPSRAQEIDSQGAQPARFGAPPRPASTGGGAQKTVGRPQTQYTVPDSIPQGARRTYTCNHCSQRFEAVKAGAMGCPTSVPRYKIGFFTAAESTKCPACQTRVVFPMNWIRLCVYVTIFFGSLTYLMLDIARGARIDFFRPIFVGFFAFTVIRDVSMRHAYAKLEQYTDAIAAYKKAIAIKPDEAEAYYQMGNAYLKLKQYADAIAAYKKCIALKPTGEDADNAKRFIRQIENRDKP